MPTVDVEKKIIEIIILIRAFLADRKVGNIQINMFKSGISSINVNETIKSDKNEWTIKTF